ncbi:MAG: hypothetical protein ACR2RF_01380 [Geminicoccaceae bacterium]
MKIQTVTLALAMGTLLSGCLGQDPLVGKGAVNLSPDVQQGFEQYLQERSPGHFAVSADGRYAQYNYCPDGRCLRGSKNSVIYACEKRSKGSPCKIYGAYGEVVWQESKTTVN